MKRCLFFALLCVGTSLLAIPSQNNLSGQQTLKNSVWSSLNNMSLQEKQNSCISLVLEKNASQEALQMAKEIENLWNNGNFDAATSMFLKLAKITNPNEINLGNKWRIPVSTKERTKWGQSVRIGNRDSIIITAFDVDRSSGNLFAVVLFQTGTQYFWAVNFSDDGGLTWTETYHWNAIYKMKSLSAAVVNGYCYIAFGRDTAQAEAFLYRVKTVDGVQDTFPNGSSYMNLFTTTSPDSIKEVALVSNQDGYNNTLYYQAIINDGALKCFWATASILTWTEFTTGITDADRGMDATCNEKFAEYFLFTSFFDKNDSLKIYGKDVATFIQQCSKYYGTGTSHTAISAYDDTIFCIADYNGSNLWCRYQISYNAGSDWAWGSVDSTTTTQESPDVTLRKGGGIGVIYRFYTLPREARFTHRTYALGSWETPVAYSEYQPFWNKPCIEYLGSDNYGIVYLTNSTPTIRGAYFNSSTWIGIEEKALTPTLAKPILSIYPNPSKENTTLQLSLTKPGNVDISVYNTAGMVVKKLTGTYQMGTHNVNLDTRILSSGIYFVNVKTADFTKTTRMTIIK
ncbi:MAG: T9SS type A sorting domain-containing protein [bacterium]|nr:T9SS type A sorting domain-containing protein [bacterium]